MTLPQLTWDEAEARDVWPASAYRQAYAVTATTIRRWVVNGELRPVAIGPANARLYRRTEVLEVRARIPERRARRRVA